MAVMLFTEQCLQERLHLSVKITVPKMGDFFLHRIVLIPNFAKYTNDDVFNLCISPYIGEF